MNGLLKDRTLVLIYVIFTSLESDWNPAVGDHCNKELCEEHFAGL